MKSAAQVQYCTLLILKDTDSWENKTKPTKMPNKKQKSNNLGTCNPCTDLSDLGYKTREKKVFFFISHSKHHFGRRKSLLISDLKNVLEGTCSFVPYFHMSKSAKQM